MELPLPELIKRLEGKKVRLDDLELQVKIARKERDKLALKIIDTGKISIRQVAKHAGVSNVRLVQLRKARKNNVGNEKRTYKQNGNR